METLEITINYTETTSTVAVVKTQFFPSLHLEAFDEFRIQYYSLSFTL